MKTKAKPGNPGLRGRLMDKSVEAYTLSLETINRLSIKYRIETFTYLICNAWELLLKAKILQDEGCKTAICYPCKPGERTRTLAIRDCLKKVLPNENDPVRRNLELVIELRDAAVHLVILQVPKDVMSLFQSCVLNYHKYLVDWFGVSLSGRVSVGMMALVYDFNPEEFDLKSPILRRKLGRETADYLASFQAEMRKEFDNLGKAAEFALDINYKLALVQKPGAADIVLSKGESGSLTRVVEVPKDPSRTHPYRQKETIERINTFLSGKAHVNSHGFQCILNVYDIRKRPDFHYRGAIAGSPAQYSEAFVQWILKQYENDSSFFIKARAKAKQNRCPCCTEP